MVIMDIREVVSKAVLIEERRRGGEIKTASAATSADRLKEWEKLLNVPENDSIFQKRLQYDGITTEEALTLCGECDFPENLELPSWAKIIRDVMELLPVSAEEALHSTSLCKEDIDLTGPILSLFPFVKYCEDKLKANYKELPMADLSSMVLNRLYQTVYQTFNSKARFMILMGHKSEEGLWEKIEGDLLSGGWQGLFTEYPVLARRMGTSIEQVLAFVEEFLQRFYQNKEVIENEFFQGKSINKIINIIGEISDLHQNGRSVLILTFDENRKLVYKPRTLEIDVRWERFTSEFSPAKVMIKAPHAMDLGEYGFVEFVHHEPCQNIEEIKSYFYNSGALMALIYAFGGNDFHRENIISVGTHPVIIDTETLMIPVARPFEQGGRDPAEQEKKSRSLAELMDTSVLMQGMLPLIKTDDNNNRNDLGGLSGTAEGLDNLPVYNCRQYSSIEFPEQVADGFKFMYHQILENREELLEGKNGIRLFGSCKFRMLIRQSQAYANVIKHISKSANLKDGFAYSLQTERMVKAFLFSAKDEIIPGLLRVFKSEKNALENGCIPIFYGEPQGEGILDDQELLFENYFAKSPQKNAADYIKNMSEADLAIQLQIIEKSLTAETGEVHTALTTDASAVKKTSRRIVTNEELIHEAENIYKDIMDDRFIASDGEYSWLTQQYDVKSGGVTMGLMGPTLYDGLLGMAVFTGALYRLTEKLAYKETADYCIDKTVKQMEAIIPVMERYRISLGYSNGIGGYIAGLRTSAQYTGNKDAAETANKLLHAITEKSIFNDTALDVLGGISGLVLALTKDDGLLNDSNCSEYTKQLLEWCGKHLLAERSKALETYQVWNSKEGSQPLTGLGHGVSGIALALVKIYETIGGAEYLDAASNSIGYENAVYDEDSWNWPDYRIDKRKLNQISINPVTENPKRFMSGYCAGAPGIGLSRLGLLKSAGGNQALKEALDRDLKRANHFVKEVSLESRDHLCCGRTGGIDFLIEKAMRLDDAEAMECAKEKISALIFEKQVRGHYSLMNADGHYTKNPTLFQGTAGIGYEMLRIAAPEIIKSILI